MLGSHILRERIKGCCWQLPKHTVASMASRCASCCPGGVAVVCWFVVRIGPCVAAVPESCWCAFPIFQGCADGAPLFFLVSAGPMAGVPVVRSDGVCALRCCRGVSRPGSAVLQLCLAWCLGRLGWCRRPAAMLRRQPRRAGKCFLLLGSGVVCIHEQKLETRLGMANLPRAKGSVPQWLPGSLQAPNAFLVGFVQVTLHLATSHQVPLFADPFFENRL